MILRPLVAIYRYAAEKEIIEECLRVEADFDSRLREAILEVWRTEADLIDYVSVDGMELFSADDMPEKGTSISISITLPAWNANRFYSSVSDLINKAASLSRGEMPSDFFLIEENWFTEDQNDPPAEIDKLRILCRLIKGIGKFARYHDEREATGRRRLVFIQPDPQTRISTVALETRITPKIVQYPSPDLKNLDELLDSGPDRDPHHQPKVDVFTSTLSEFLSEAPSGRDPFEYLVEYWDSFSQRYMKNFGTYISGFGFQKAKREVAEEMFKLAERFSKLTSDIAGKVFSIPLSFAAVYALDKAVSTLEKSIILVALCITSVIVAVAVYNQQRELSRIVHARDIVLGSIQGRREQFPDDLRSKVDEFQNRGRRDELTLGALLWVYQVLAWVPAFAGAATWYFLSP